MHECYELPTPPQLSDSNFPTSYLTPHDVGECGSATYCAYYGRGATAQALAERGGYDLTETVELQDSRPQHRYNIIYPTLVAEWLHFKLFGVIYSLV